MPVAMIWGPPGSGKTVAATASQEGKQLLLCSDNSDVVLNMFPRPNLTKDRVQHWVAPEGQPDNCFARQFEKALASKKYSHIVVDNLTDLKELALQEIEDEGKLRDIRQIFQAVYMALKRLTRQAANADCNVVFTAWSTTEDITLSDGTMERRQSPNLPPKIIDQILGLCNIVAYMTHTKSEDSKSVYYCVTEGSETLYGCKDQLFGRKTCYPKDLFTPATKKEEVRK